jgi:hypothetical protein
MSNPQRVELAASWQVTKADAPQRRVFGWANISVDKGGEAIVDAHGDIIPPLVLEEAAYRWVAEFRAAGTDHDGQPARAVAIESFYATPEKAAALGIPDGVLPRYGWFVGVQFHDDEAFESVVRGDRPMFSIEGTAMRVPVDEEA